MPRTGSTASADPVGRRGLRCYRRSTMAYPTDPRVDAYIEGLPDWQQVICREVRDLVHAADPEVSETIKRTNRPYFVLHGNICALLAARTNNRAGGWRKLKQAR